MLIKSTKVNHGGLAHGAAAFGGVVGDWVRISGRPRSRQTIIFSTALFAQMTPDSATSDGLQRHLGKKDEDRMNASFGCFGLDQKARALSE